MSGSLTRTMPMPMERAMRRPTSSPVPKESRLQPMPMRSALPTSPNQVSPGMKRILEGKPIWNQV